MSSVYMEYDPADLKRIQEIELEMLRDFDNLCNENNIDYFCWAGTAIGVLRHKGFIPWDDDIDIGLLRADYEKLLRCINEQMGEKYYLLNTKNDPEYPLMTTRMVLRGTVFLEECFKDLKCNFGIFLDLYCFDYVPESELIWKKKCQKMWLKSKLMILCAIGEPVLYIKGIKGRIVKNGCKLVHSALTFFHIKPIDFFNSIEIELQKNNNPTNKIAFQFGTKLYSNIFFINDIFPTKMMPFERMMIKCPANIEKITELMYGNYMELPPPDKRHNHPPVVLDFGRYNNNSCDKYS